MTSKVNKKRNKKGKPKQVTVSKKVMRQLKLSPRVEVLEQAVKQMQGVNKMLLDNLEASRRLNAHYLVSINTLAKEIVKRGITNDTLLFETRAEVIAEADFEKQKADWMGKPPFHDLLTDKWYFLELDSYYEQGPFLDEEAAKKAAMQYLAEAEVERSIVWSADKPEMLVDRLTKVEKIVTNTFSAGSELIEDISPSSVVPEGSAQGEADGVPPAEEVAEVT
jgi:hypothetical protein